LDYSPTQNVQANDILFVHEGTYLIGSVAMVTEFDSDILYQHHLAKFKVNPTCPFNAFFLLAALESPLIRRQVRSKQFSADIIDSVVGRLIEIVIPIPKDRERLRQTELEAENAVLGRARLREQIASSSNQLDRWLRNENKNTIPFQSDKTPSRSTAFLGGRRGFSATLLPGESVSNNILLPKYYDPWVDENSGAYKFRCNLRTLGDLIEDGIVELVTGDEIGRLNYGTGDIPFVRTSDFGSWELKREAKQGVSKAVHAIWSEMQDVNAGDILFVRDGTYLVGTSVLICEDDLPLLYCGGIYKLRTLKPSFLPPGLLFALLNIPFVKRQIRNKQFTRDVIDTLGRRITELVLPIPKESSISTVIGAHFQNALAERTHLRSRLHKLTDSLFTVSDKMP
jgi:hypothetical protein